MTQRIIVVVLASVLLPGAALAQKQPTQTEVKERVTTVRETVTTITEEERAERNASLLAAIFIKNRAGDEFADKVQATEDLVVAAVTDLGFRTLSPEDTLKSVRTFLNLGPEEAMPVERLDELLDSRTSALRLAQNMGVDYLLIASITTYGRDSQRLKRPDLGIDQKVVSHKLRVTYKILDGSTGESLSSGTITSTQKTQESEELEESQDVVNDLLADAAEQLAAKLDTKGGVGAVPLAKKVARFANFTVHCDMQDMTVPEVLKDDAGNYVLGENRHKLEQMSVTVELDGITLGTTPGPFEASPGLHKVRLSREGFRDWERTINIREGLNLNVALILSDEGRDQWMDMAQFLSDLKGGEKLTDAQAEAILGYAQMMRQSGIRVDRRSDVKVNTSEAPVIQQNNIDQQNVATGSVWP